MRIGATIFIATDYSVVKHAKKAKKEPQNTIYAKTGWQPPFQETRIISVGNIATEGHSKNKRIATRILTNKMVNTKFN